MSHRVILVIASVVAGLLYAACAGPVPLDRAIRPQDDQDYRQMLTADPTSPKASWYVWSAAKAGISVAEAKAQDEALSTTRNPFQANRDRAAVSRGAVIYRAHCQRCHGADARGDGGDLLAGYAPGDMHGLAQRFAVTLHGGAPRAWFRKINDGFGDVVPYADGAASAMPAFGNTLAREQIWQVITYLQSLDVHYPADPQPTAGK